MRKSTADVLVIPGHIVPATGLYEDITTGQRITLERGEAAPPTREQESAWRQVVDDRLDAQ